jgi:5-methylcytosine-specific restriction endonuclease McrA
MKRSGIARRTPLPRATQPLARTKLKAKGTTKPKRQKRYAAFLRSPAWRAQRKRVLERDGYRCTASVLTAHAIDGLVIGTPHVGRCHYMADDGPLTVDHLAYGHTGLENVPDEKLRTLCPAHHNLKDGWKWQIK